MYLGQIANGHGTGRVHLLGPTVQDLAHPHLGLIQLSLCLWDLFKQTRADQLSVRIPQIVAPGDPFSDGVDRTCLKGGHQLKVEHMLSRSPGCDLCEHVALVRPGHGAKLPKGAEEVVVA